jgi:hypothetical protein
MLTLRTERLILREWKEADREPFARMGADPRVMEFLGETLSRKQSDEAVERIERISERTDLGYTLRSWPKAASSSDSSGWQYRRSRRPLLRAWKLDGDSRPNIGTRDSLQKAPGKVCVMHSENWGCESWFRLRRFGMNVRGA